METAQEYSNYSSSETCSVKPLVENLTGHLSSDDVVTAIEEDNLFEVPKFAVLPSSKELKGDFKLLQMWEGLVQAIDQDHHEFTAIVKDKTNPTMPDEEFTMSIEEIPPTDLALLASGAVFYWSIGYADYPGRPRTRESRIRFRRLPKWHQSELNKAKERGKQLADFFTSY